jgi:hypothetical protein
VYSVYGVLEQARPSQPLTVIVRVGNFGQGVVILEIPCPLFRVTNRAGEVVGPSSAGCAGAPPSTITLLPGESRLVTGQWAGGGADGATLPHAAAYGLEASTRRVDRHDPVATGVLWVCLVPDTSPPPDGRFHDCGLPGDAIPSRNLPPGTAPRWTDEGPRF